MSVPCQGAGVERCTASFSDGGTRVFPRDCYKVEQSRRTGASRVGAKIPERRQLV